MPFGVSCLSNHFVTCSIFLIPVNTVLLTYSLTQLLTHFFTYLLTPFSRVLLQKLTDSQPVKKFPAFYGTRRFITSVTSARHLSLS